MPQPNPYSIPELDEESSYISDANALADAKIRDATAVHEKDPYWKGTPLETDFSILEDRFVGQNWLEKTLSRTSTSLYLGAVDVDRDKTLGQLRRAGAEWPEVEKAMVPFNEARHRANLETDSWWGDGYLHAVQMTPLIGGGIQKGMAYGGTLAAAGSMLTAGPDPTDVVTAPMAFAWGFHTGNIQHWVEMGTNEAYYELLKDTDMSAEEANFKSQWIGLPYGLVEYSQYLLATKGLSVASKSILEASKKASKDVTKKGVFKADKISMVKLQPITEQRLKHPFLAAGIQTAGAYAGYGSIQLAEEGVQKMLIAGTTAWENADKTGIPQAFQNTINAGYEEMKMASGAIAWMQMLGVPGHMYHYVVENNKEADALRVFDQFRDFQSKVNYHHKALIETLSDPKALDDIIEGMT